MYFDLRAQHVGGASAMSCLVSLALFLVVGSIVGVGQSVKEQHSSHTNNWAVLVCSSRYWFNYRHVANTLSIYRSVKRLGIPDSNIILMLADDMACNARNPRPATVFNNANEHINVYGDDIEVDYRGYEVTVENFLRVLTGRLDSSTPRSKRLLSDDRSNILIYMTGHGGDGFLKFQDAEEISSAELADAFEQMWQKRRYNELMFTIETCQAASMIHKFYSPNIVASGSSRVGEDALSHHMDSAIGVHIIDRWTYYALEFLEKVTSGSKATLKDFFGYFDPDKVKSHPEVRTDLFKRELTKVLVTDFFGSVRNTEMLNMTTQQDTVTFLHHLQSLRETNNVCDSEEEDTCHQSSPSPSPPPLPPAHQLQPSDHLNISCEAGSPLSVSFPSLTHQFLGMTILVAMTTVASIGLYVLVSAPSVR